MRTLDRNRPFGTIHGEYEPFPEARFQQFGAMFTNDGTCIAVTNAKGIVVAYEPEEVKAGEPEESKPGKSLADMFAEATKEAHAAEALVAKLEEDLDAAKKGDINAPDYTAKCAGIQKELTKAKTARTKAVNAAAVLQEKVAEAK